MQERSVHMDDLIPLIRESLSLQQSVSFSPKGVSMLPMLRQGKDTVTLSAVNGQLKKYDIPLYRRDDGAYVLHRVVSAGKTYTCIGDNQFYFETGIRPDQIIAVVSGFTRGKKYRSVTSAGYRLYCRFWCGTRRMRWLLFRVKRKLSKIFKCK